MTAKKYTEFRGGIEGKTCNKCQEWKDLDSYFYDKNGVGKRYSICKSCKKAAGLKYTRPKDSYKRYYSRNKERLKERSRKYRQDHLEERRQYDKEYRQINREKRNAYLSEWAKNNRKKRQATELRRRARKKKLISDFPVDKQEEVIKYFNGCALTGDLDFHWDHVIPISTGHGSGSYKNIIPLRGDLNLSKSTSNIFEWFQANRQRFELEQERFDKLIMWLSDLNNMSVSQYKAWVDYCHQNPKKQFEE